MIKRALISVWNKDGLLDLANFLNKNGIEIISTGGTHKYLNDNNIPVTEISEITGMDSVMNGRVKTLNPKIFGGILADRDNNNHLDDLNKINGKTIDLIVVNLYPFVDEAVKKKLPMKKAIEYIDIGGPSMLRAAAKNYHSVCVLSDISDYLEFINEFDQENKTINLGLRKVLASRVFFRTSQYDSNIYSYFNKDENFLKSDTQFLYLEKVQDLRYGENPHQKASFCVSSGANLNWLKYQGKKLSYNNYLDIGSGYDIVNNFKEPSCSIIKHSNPCGFALGEDLLDAYKRAVSCDPVSYFGGIISFNGKVEEVLAKKLVEPFLECVIAPDYSKEALEVFKQKDNLRVISSDYESLNNKYDIRTASGGYLLQEKDFFSKDFSDYKIVTKKKPSRSEISGLVLGWKLVRFVKSNAIVIANSKQILGVGAGQMSRIDSAEIAIRKIKQFSLNLDKSIMASDAFFPFSDCIELAAKNGVKSIIQPGGSINDQENINVADDLGISMVFTSSRHFYH
ncbi:MAG: bifunctional phosphoribosylaminoimidazolecarboxamide formyltransferase/inosine monophosphate cyclohydrolase [Candidatus Marinimicrobia bacterium]|nr:bifunctional phosphoribosylaminoimidazolecarboxamide formyltransferase/inosine monophosphate cyclohydrolase [Candidatus Neomarinimicrobiota bacterium]|tara:strand:- start:1383 stop:2915 length:1533 start_codon:yes stop_codon:yes gene_type:complete